MRRRQSFAPRPELPRLLGGLAWLAVTACGDSQESNDNLAPEVDDHTVDAAMAAGDSDPVSAPVSEPAHGGAPMTIPIAVEDRDEPSPYEAGVGSLGGSGGDASTSGGGAAAAGGSEPMGSSGAGESGGGPGTGGDAAGGTTDDAGPSDAGMDDGWFDAGPGDGSVPDAGRDHDAGVDAGAGGTGNAGGASSVGGAAGSAGAGGFGGMGMAGAGGLPNLPCDGECGSTDPWLGDLPRLCCDDTCINPNNDPDNCGACGEECWQGQVCQGGNCVTPPCQGFCGGFGATCCGTDCCGFGETCCDSQGPVGGLACVQLDPGETCPVGCAPLCECVSPGTLIATANGDVPIEALRVGDLVYSVDHDAIVLVPLRDAQSRPVENHHVRRLLLDDGSVLEISQGHPMGDGTSIGALSVGDPRGSVTIVAAEVIPYLHPRTYDILPDSSTGTYFANGLLLGSTLFQK